MIIDDVSRNPTPRDNGSKRNERLYSQKSSKRYRGSMSMDIVMARSDIVLAGRGDHEIMLLTYS